MIYYFVDQVGDITTEENVKGWYEKSHNPDMFTTKREAIARAKKNVKEMIKELEEKLVELRSFK